ncbi:MAG: hypothetical protein AB1411_13365 [Nitrospirota bacterium]
MRSSWTKAVVVVMILALAHLTVTPTGWAAEPAKTSSVSTEDPNAGTLSGAGLGAASWLVTLPYGAVKIAFAILGGVTGGLTWVFSGGNNEAAMSVVGTSVYGTYVITPEHLTGDRSVRFLGVPANDASGTK